MSSLGAQLTLWPARLEVPGAVFPSRRDFRMKVVASLQLHSSPGLSFPGHRQEVGLSMDGPKALGGAQPAAALELPHCPREMASHTWLRETDHQGGGWGLLATHLSHWPLPISLHTLGMTKHFLGRGWGMFILVPLDIRV